MLKSCIIGYGNIAMGHKKGYDMLTDVELVAVCDIRKERREQAVSDGLRAYENVGEMLKNESPDFVDICLPTYLHCEYTVAMLEKGYHVLCEKPMGRNMDECNKMLDAAKKSGKQLMIGMCLRYNTFYNKLKEYVDSGEYGKVTSATMHRISPLPPWGYNNWFAEEELSGGAILDMSIHDIDICRYIFGEPEKFTAVADHRSMKNGAVHTELIYSDKIISIRGDWCVAKAYPFKAGFCVNFEKATLALDGKEMTLYTDDEVIPFGEKPYNHMAAEIAHFAKVVKGEAESTAKDSAKTVELITKIQGELLCR